MLSAECLFPLYAKVSSNPDVDTKTVSDTFGYRFFHKNASLSGGGYSKIEAVCLFTHRLLDASLFANPRTGLSEVFLCIE